MATTKRKTRQRPNTTTFERELPTNPDALLTKQEVADMLGVKLRWVERAIGSGELPYVKVGKLVRIKRSDVLAYIDAQTRSAR